MTTEHVSVPRTVEDVRNWHLHQLRTLKEAWQPYEHHKACAAILSRATPSDGSAELNYAKSLATSMWEKHYAKDAPQWESCDDLYGVLSQIDNMLTGLQRGKPSAPRVVTAELSNTIAGDIAEHLRDKGWSSGGDYQDDFLPDVEIATRAALESFAAFLPAARVPDDYRKVTADAVRVIVKCADEYRSAVRDVFALREDGKPYAERDTTKDSDAMWAFQRLNDAGARLVECCARIQPALIDAAPQAGEKG